MPALQAARGASLIASETSEEPTGEGADGEARPGRRRTGLALLIALVALLTDQLSKYLAVRELEGRMPVEVVGELLQLRLVRNPGAAFSAGASITPVISVIAVVATVVTFYYVLRVRHLAWSISLGLLLAGVSGNLVDRLFRPPGPLRGEVVDFFALPNWPVFNVADICIDVAGVLLVVLVLRGIHVDGTREPPPTKSPR